MNETLGAMARALFKSWFVDFDPVRAKAVLKRHATHHPPLEGGSKDDSLSGRGPPPPHPPAPGGLASATPPQGGSDWTVERARAYLDSMEPAIAALFPDRLADSELGEIPEGWEVTELGNCVTTVKGTSYRSSEIEASDTALVTLKSFERGGGYCRDGLKPFTGRYKPEQTVRFGEIVIACTDVTQAADIIGRPALVSMTKEYVSLVASLDTMIVRPVQKASIGRAFLYCLAASDSFVAHSYAHTTGTTVLHLARNTIPSFLFACPKVELTRRFERICAPLFQRVLICDQLEDTLAAIRDTLLPKLVSGEIRIRDAEGFLDAGA